MSTSITTFPFSADKISELPVVTAILGSDKIPVTASGVTSAITKTNLISDLDFQPHTDALDALSNEPPTNEALFLINTLITPETNSYLRIDTDGLTLPRNYAQVRSDIQAQPSNSTLTLLATKVPSDAGINFLQLLPPFAPDVPTPGTYYFPRISSSAGNAVTMRTSAQTLTDIGAMPLTYLVTSANLFGGNRLDEAHVPSTAAMAHYVDARIGSGVKDVSDDVIASAITLDLDTTDGAQVDITGTTSPTLISLAAGVQKVLKFKGILTINPVSGKILTPNDKPIITTVDSFATAIGNDDGSVTITNYYESAFLIHYGGDFSTGGTFDVEGNFQTNGNFYTDDEVSIGGALTTTQTGQLEIITTAATHVTMPPGTHALLGRDSYATTATAAGTTTLTVASEYQQFFTGSTTQNARLPVASTLTLGFSFRIVNLSSGNVTVQSSGANTIATLSSNTAAILTCILTSGTSAASWSAI